jgi:hypothetical protein
MLRYQRQLAYDMAGYLILPNIARRTVALQLFDTAVLARLCPKRRIPRGNAGTVYVAPPSWSGRCRLPFERPSAKSAFG